jgi:hypothetical protein
MTAAFALLRLFAGDPLGYIWKWIQHASFWQLVSLGLAALFIVQHFQLVSARHSAAKWEATAGKWKSQLDGISTTRDVQKQVSTRTVTRVIQGQVQVRTVVEHIHDAPNPPDCGTPDVDQLRNVL